MNSKIIMKIINRALPFSKTCYSYIELKSGQKKKIIFIVGCQRSGTTMMTRIFDRDFRTKVYAEFSELSSKSRETIRLKNLDEVEKEISKNKKDVIVVKPLVETQNCDILLRRFKRSNAVFMFRNFKDVVSSNLKRFNIKKGVEDLQPIIEGQHADWRSEKVVDSTRETIKRFFHKNMNPNDAAALFWYSRNKLFFDLKLDGNANVHLCKYEELVTEPYDTIKQLYNKIEIENPWKILTYGVHAKSINKGRKIILSAEVESLCASMLDCLNQTYQKNK